jgi:hypothetical protein
LATALRFKSQSFRKITNALTNAAMLPPFNLQQFVCAYFKKFTHGNPKETLPLDKYRNAVVTANEVSIL